MTGRSVAGAATVQQQGRRLVDDGTGPYGTGIAYNPYGTVVATPGIPGVVYSPYNYAPTTTLVHQPLVGYGKK
jgi:hypothetical protein